jgi:hypothetical protein
MEKGKINFNSIDEDSSGNNKSKCDINVFSQMNIRSYEEKLLNIETLNYSKIYPISIVSKRSKLMPTTLNFDLDNQQIVLVPIGDDFRITINFKDVLGFVSEDDMDSGTLGAIKKQLERNIEEIRLSMDSHDKFVNLNFYPNFKSKKCNCCGWICCKCTNIINERKAKVIYLPSNIVEHRTFYIPYTF